MNLNITVKEGGERLYIYPFAQKNGEKSVIFPPIQEFPPDGDEFDFLNNSYWQFYNKLNYLTVIKYFCIRGLKAFRYSFNSFYTDLKRFLRGGFFYHNFINDFCLFFKVSPPVLGKEFFGVLGINNQIMVEDPNFYTETFYLKPSQTYLRIKIDELIEFYLSGKDKYGEFDAEDADYYKNIAQNYLKWKENWINKGYEIKFLFSLDT